MKIKQEFWKLIKQGKKTIELRKVTDWNKYFLLPIVNTPITGRHENKVYDTETDNYLGTITINGYSIIPNLFKRTDFQKMYELSKIDFHVKNRFKNEICDLGNNCDEKWIYDNWEWLTNYYQDEKEILVLKIESYKEA